MLRWIVLFWSLLVGAAAHAAPPQDLQSQLQDIQRIIASSTTKIEAIQAAMVAAMRVQRDISLKLVSLNKDMQKRRVLIEAMRQRLEPLLAEEDKRAANFKIQRGKLRAVISELIRARQAPHREIAAGILSDLVPRVQKQKALSQKALMELQATRQVLQKEYDALNTATAQLQRDEETLVLLQHQKQAFAAATSKDLAAEKQKSAQLAAQAKNLYALIRAMAETKPTPAIKDETNPIVLFADQMGKLILPAQGLVSARFGDDTGLGVALEGIGIVTSPLAPVVSPLHATVEFAGAFRSYGQLVILNAGEGYLVLLAGMSQISATQGQEVWAGEPIGIMGEKPSAPGLLGEKTRKNRPNLYIEFRKDNRVIDSTPWWIDGLKEAVNDTRR